MKLSMVKATGKSLVLWCALVVVCLGCGRQGADYSLVDLVNAGGTVTFDGKPLPNAVVTFEDPTDDTFSYAMTDSNGKYVLQFDSEMAGVKTGKKVVRISTTRRIPGLNSKPGQEEDSGSPEAKNRTELVPEKYNKKSELTADVAEGTTQFNFDLVNTR